ncbi:unnamed protein product [Rotaria sp. Silwood1]|nr:unnamed protein product [Rotaria sp. Silwood1]CAF3668721.1 unnamed protein product [Rotaria sp. Silwood1]CAF4861758.1 unnamed protein product [Rotaria sp. Silwood1]
MTWSYQEYVAASLSIHFGLGVVIVAVLFYLIRWRPRTFYRMIEAMFSIKHCEATPCNAREFIDVYGVQIGLSATTLGFLPALALFIMATAVLTATFILFLSELIFITRYVSPNSKCPSDNEMDCYTTVNDTKSKSVSERYFCSQCGSPVYSKSPETKPKKLLLN